MADNSAGFNPRRLGIFRISARIIHTAPRAAIEVLSGILVVKAQSMFEFDAVEYMGIHPRFAPVGEGEIVPMYTYTIKDLVGGKYAVEWHV